jgi:serine/threonine protein kinase
VRRKRLFAEVRIARQVSHPNICRVYDIGELEGRHFLTMEYIDGEDLASLLKRIGSLHGAKAVDVAQQLCAGLAAAHDKGVLHRDLKPANVMIDGRGPVRITDFGLAVAAGEEIPEADVSGTPPYMAPEQFAGKGAIVWLDSRGRLTGLRVIPQKRHPQSGSVKPPDWPSLFKASGFDPAEYTPAEP